MSLSTLDPHVALILIDLQKGIVALPSAHPMNAVVNRAATLAAAFRRHSLPVVLVNVVGGAPGRTDIQMSGGARPADFAELVPELDRQPDDIAISKRTWGAFMHTDLDAQLRERGTTQVVVAGVATSIGVESTARQAFELGYNVVLANDAMTDMNAEAHENSVARVFPRLGERATSADIVALLDAP